jgi:outer membrane protein OmpA-like peptidoglycan-associated protein
MLRTILGVAFLLATLSLPAQTDSGYRFKVLDLVFRVEDIGGRVEDMRVRETDLETRLELNADVLFEFDKADLLPKGEEVLGKAAEYLQGKKGTIRIEGHTDAKGDDDYNMRLSLKRADSVRRWFTEKAGIPASQMTSKGLGEKNPVAPNTKPDGSDDPGGRQRNRRVEIVVSK